MSEPFIGEVTMFGFNYSPRGYAFCNGQLLPIAQNQALFSILGTTYGGNGTQTFGLPDLQGKSPMHVGQGPGLSPVALGQTGGESSHTLLLSEMPTHSHLVTASSVAADLSLPTSNYFATGGQSVYSSAAADVALSSAALTSIGGNQGHNNMPPYSVLNFCIALVGTFPSRN